MNSVNRSKSTSARSKENIYKASRELDKSIKIEANYINYDKRYVNNLF